MVNRPYSKTLNHGRAYLEERQIWMSSVLIKTFKQHNKFSSTLKVSPIIISTVPQYIQQLHVLIYFSLNQVLFASSFPIENL